MLAHRARSEFIVRLSTLISFTSEFMWEKRLRNIYTTFHWLIGRPDEHDAKTYGIMYLPLWKLVHIKPCTWSRAMPYSALHAMMCCHTNKNDLFPYPSKFFSWPSKSSFFFYFSSFKYFFSRFNPHFFLSNKCSRFANKYRNWLDTKRWKDATNSL